MKSFEEEQEQYLKKSINKILNLKELTNKQKAVLNSFYRYLTIKSYPTTTRYLYLHKAKLFRDYIKSYKERIEKDLNGTIKHAFIEAPLQNTPKNINTTALLLGFNGMARYILMEVLEIMPIKISVYESRKLFCHELVKVSYRKGERIETLSFPEKYRKDKKKYIWEKVAKLEPQIKWFYTRNNTLKDFCYDLSDSYAVGIAGLKQLKIIK